MKELVSYYSNITTSLCYGLTAQLCLGLTIHKKGTLFPQEYMKSYILNEISQKNISINLLCFPTRALFLKML